MSVSDEWQKKIEDSQGLTHYRVADRYVLRVKYGSEADDWGANDHPCFDCAAAKGQLHVPGCDGEECPNCGGQAISCNCEIDIDSATGLVGER